jgi:O-antigen/teichoic acid export membrane protein
MELVYIAFLNVLAKGLKFLFEVGSSFFLDRESYGKFVLIISYILIYTKIITFGMQNILVREVPKRSKSYIKKILFNALIIVILISIIIYSLLIFFNIKYLSEYKIIFFIATIMGITILFSTYLRAIKQVKLWIIFQELLVYVIYFFIILILFIIYGFAKFSINTILFIFILSLFINVIILFIYLMVKHKIVGISRISLEIFKYLISNSLPVLFAGLTLMIISRIDVIMLSNYVQFDKIGDYNKVVRIAFQVMFFNQVIISYYFPRLAEMFAKKYKYSEITKYNTKFVILSGVSVFILSIFLYVLIIKFNLFEILQIKYQQEMMIVFFILVISQFIVSFLNFYANILIYIHKQYIEFVNNFIVLFIVLGLNYILISVYGTIGAAISTSFALIFGNLIRMLEVKKFTGTFFISFKKVNYE